MNAGRATGYTPMAVEWYHMRKWSFCFTVKSVICYLKGYTRFFSIFLDWLQNSSDFITRILNNFFAFRFIVLLPISYTFRSHLSDAYLPSKNGCNSSDLTDTAILRQQESPSRELVKRSFGDHHPWWFRVSLQDAAILTGRFSANSIWHSVCQLTTFCSKLSRIPWCIAATARLLHSPNLVTVGTRMLVLPHVYAIGQSRYRSGKSKIALDSR